jgi:hypothetical protein
MISLTASELIMIDALITCYFRDKDLTPPEYLILRKKINNALCPWRIKDENKNGN